MFSTLEKHRIADELERILLRLHHPEMPDEKPSFKLHVDGKEGWSWADIEPNWKRKNNLSCLGQLNKSGLGKDAGLTKAP